MQITLELDDYLLEEARNVAAKRNTTVSAVVEDALREVFARMKRPRDPVNLPVSRSGGGLKPGVNISNMAELLDILDGDDPINKLR